MLREKRVFNLFVLTIATMMALMVGPTFASAEKVSFKDVKKSNDHYDNIILLAEGGVFNSENDYFNPYKPITRAQVATVFTRALLLDIPNDPVYAAYHFDDVSLKNEHLHAITTVVAYGIFTDKSKKFNPYNPITREQMATVLVRALSLDDIPADNVPLTDTRISKTHKQNVQVLANLGITNQTDNFRAYDNIQRDQFATFIVRTFDALQE